jgi:amino acid transporter
VIAIYSTRIVGLINSAAVGLELVIVVALGIALTIAVVATGSGSTSNLTSRGIAEHAPNYFGVGGGLMMAMIMGIATLVGFEAAANMAEEAKDPFRTVPRAIIGSITASGVLGMLFLIVLTVAIDDMARISASKSPVALIIHDQLGSVVERVLLVGIIFAFFGGGLVPMVTCPRIVFAMSRDERFPGHRLMRRINRRTRTPVLATILIFTVGLILMLALPGKALLKLIEASAITGMMLYGMTVILYLAVRKRLGRRKGAFELGRFEVPVAVGALVWVAIVLFMLISPKGSHVAVLVTVGLLLVGGVYLAYLWIVKREVLDREPGEDIFDVDGQLTK